MWLLILYKELNIQWVLNFTYSCLSVLLCPEVLKKDMWLTFRQNQSGIVYPPSNMLQTSGTMVDCKHGSHIRQESLKWQKTFKKLCSTMWCQIANRDKTKWSDFLHSLWYWGPFIAQLNTWRKDTASKILWTNYVKPSNMTIIKGFHTCNIITSSIKRKIRL